STSRPVHSPLSLANEKPGRPRCTPHSMLPRALTASSVGLGASCCAPADAAARQAAKARPMDFMSKLPSTGAPRYRTSPAVTSQVSGLPNLHSHAFQRAMAGLTERRGSDSDSFWTWREQMYRFVERLTPDDLEAIAAYAYMEMLEAGFTWVAEFHYLHHQPDGRPYDNPCEMSERIVSAADTAGTGLTLLPVLYRQNGFLGKPPSPGQKRFLCGRDLYARLMETKVPGGAIGIAPHSLRALTLDDVKWAAETWPQVPAHIHISEQTR